MNYNQQGIQQYNASADNNVSKTYDIKRISQSRMLKYHIISFHVHVHINNQHIPTCIHQNQLSADKANSQCINFSCHVVFIIQ